MIHFTEEINANKQFSGLKEKQKKKSKYLKCKFA